MHLCSTNICNFFSGEGVLQPKRYVTEGVLPESLTRRYISVCVCGGGGLNDHFFAFRTFWMDPKTNFNFSSVPDSQLFVKWFYNNHCFTELLFFQSTKGKESINQ